MNHLILKTKKTAFNGSPSIFKLPTVFKPHALYIAVLCLSAFASQAQVVNDNTNTTSTTANPASPSSTPAAPNALPSVTVEGVQTNDPNTTFGLTTKRSISWTKTNTPLLQTPQAVSVITKDQIDTLGARGLDEAVSYTSGVTGSNYGADSRSDWLIVRGFSPARFLDGLALPNGVWTGPSRVESYGLERIDILKGPSSILYGQMPPGGMVNMVSKRASPEKTGEVGLTYLSQNATEGFIDSTDKIGASSAWSYRLTGLVRTGDAVIDHVKDERVFIAPTLTYQPDNDTRLTILARYQSADTAMGSGFLPAQGTLLPHPQGEIPRNRFVGEPEYDKYKKDSASLGYALEQRINSTWSIRQNLRYAQAKVDHVAIGGSGLSAADSSLLNRFVYTPNENSTLFAIDNQAQADVKLGEVNNTILLGIDYNKSDNDYSFGYATAASLDIFNPVYGSVITMPQDSVHTEQKQSQLGIYAQNQAQYKQWTLTLSARQDWLDTVTYNKLSNSSADQDDQKLSMRAGINYVFDNGLAPYVAYSQSFQPTIGTDFNGNVFKPTSGEQVELGIKYQMPKSRNLITASVYDITQKNVLTVDPNHTFFSVQQGKIGIQGFELESKTNITSGLDIIANYTYMDSEVKASSDANSLGKTVSLIPKQQASLWLDYKFTNGALKGLGIGGGIRYVGATYGDIYNQWQVPSHQLLDAAIRYDINKWRIQFNIHNLLDKRYVQSCSGAAWCYYGNPRTALLTAKYIW